MNGHCSTCSEEKNCIYPYKPCDCRDLLKFIPNSLHPSKESTIKHINNVAAFLDLAIEELKTRKALHDGTKLVSPEIEMLDKWTPKLKNSTYNSEEYKNFLKQMKPALDHHYKYNRHHPEYHEKGIDGMTLMDLIELLCDWKAATLRHTKGNIEKSIDINTERFNLSPQLVNILRNSLDLFNCPEKEDISAINIKKPIIPVMHRYLERFSDTSSYKSICPVCKEGLLLTGRDKSTFILQEHDYCVLCGQQFQYMDIEEMRKIQDKEYR